MMNLVFIVGLNIDPTSIDEFGEWIQEELFMVLSGEGAGDEEIVVTYCGELNELVCDENND